MKQERVDSHSSLIPGIAHSDRTEARAHEPVLFCGFFCYLSVVPFIFVFAYSVFPTTALMLVAMLATLSFLPLALNRGAHVISQPWGPCLSASMLACNALIFLGSMNMYWAHVQPLNSLNLAREYRGVYPQLPSVAFMDAAFIQFTGNTTVVAVDNGVSMKSLDAGLNTFCAAAVVNKENTGRIEFWAVGVNCCGKGDEDKFECDDAGKPGAMNAYVMPNPTDPLFQSIGKYIAPYLARRDIFQMAVTKAESTRNLVSSKEPLLVRWTKHTKQEVINDEIIGVSLRLFANVLASIGMAVFLTLISKKFGKIRGEQRELQGLQNTSSSAAALHDFMLEVVANEDETDEALTLLKTVVRRQALSKADMCITGILVPYGVMMLCVLLSTYSSCWRNGHLIYTPFIVLLSIFIIALMATPNRFVNGVFLLLVASIGMFIGQSNYSDNMFHYCAIEDRRTYSNVQANASSGTYWDAGTLHFEKTSYLSQDHAVGFLYDGDVYCAAPILSHDGCVAVSQNTSSNTSFIQRRQPSITSFLQRTTRMHTALDVDAIQEIAAAPAQCKAVAPTRIDFWATGINCCSQRQGFRCDGADDAEAHSGVLVRSSGDKEIGSDRMQFFKAITQSISANDLPLPDNPVLIRWGRDPKKLQQDWSTKANGVILLTAMIGFLSIMTIGIMSFFYMKRMRMAELREERAERAGEEESARKEPTEELPQLTASARRDQLRV